MWYFINNLNKCNLFIFILFEIVYILLVFKLICYLVYMLDFIGNKLFGKVLSVFFNVK